MSHISREEIEKRVRAGKNVRLGHVSEYGDYPTRTLRAAIKRGELRAMTVGKTTVLPPDEAARLLGMDAPTDRQAA